MKNKKATSDKDLNFEVELYKALKSYGYLFPENTKEVERFEELYGTTEIETPFDIVSSDKVNKIRFELPKEMDFNFPVNKAAFTSNKNGIIHMPDNPNPDKTTDESENK